jgi:ParB family chromosome partitioning protein
VRRVRYALHRVFNLHHHKEITMSQEFAVLSLNEIERSTSNPRRRFDEESLNKLAESIKNQGVLQPIIVRPSSSTDGFELVAGERRWRASMIAGTKTIPAMVRELTDQQVLEIQTIENIQREDVHPLDEALGYKMLMESAGYDVPMIAAKIGMSESYIYQRLKLADLTSAAQKAFFEEKITAGHAIHLARLQPKDQAEALDFCIEPDGETVRSLAFWIERHIHLDLHSAAFKKDDPTLVPAAGTCVACPKRTGFNEDLFPDIKKKDTCTDHVCFHKKMDAFLIQRKAQLIAEGKEVIEISDGYGSSNKKILARDKWSAAGNKKCPSFKIGLVVEGHEIGSVLKICTSARCNVHHRGATPNASSIIGRRLPSSYPNYEIKRKAREIARSRAVNALVLNAGSIDRRENLRLLALAMFYCSDSELEPTCKRRGIEGKKTKRPDPDYESALEKSIETMEDFELQLLLLDLALELIATRHYPPKITKLWQDTLKRHKVDEKRLTAAAEKELKKAAAAAKAAVKAEAKKQKLQTNAKQKKAA